jgi:hypothetical protein
METQSCASYRGFAIDIKVTRPPSFSGVRSRYLVSWSVKGEHPSATLVAGLPEHISFLSQDAAFVYAERLAHRFIDRHTTDPDDACAAR